MTPITPQDSTPGEVAGGVDTHQDTHTAAVIDLVGRVLGTEQFPMQLPGVGAQLLIARVFREGGLGAVGGGYQPLPRVDPRHRRDPRRTTPGLLSDEEL